MRPASRRQPSATLHGVVFDIFHCPVAEASDRTSSHLALGPVARALHPFSLLRPLTPIATIRASASLVVDIQTHRAKQHQSLDHLLVVDADAEDRHAVI